MPEFEQAVDAIVTGDEAALARVLAANPELAQARSTRGHRSTLLHYVSANGVEDFRQKTPPNIVAIAELLLKAGADVSAESDAYAGHATTLSLTATSVHPENAGVQIALLELLLSHGATLDGMDGASVVNSCLANGRGQAAVFLAHRGARLDFEGAAGTGRLDIVVSLFDAARMPDAFAWACEFGHTPIVEFLLDKGMDAGAKLRWHHGQTGLHWAASGGQAGTVEVLLKRGARVDATDDTYGATPLGWALHAWTTSPPSARLAGHYQVVALLLAAGAKAHPCWLAHEKVRSDARMLALLHGDGEARCQSR